MTATTRIALLLCTSALLNAVESAAGRWEGAVRLPAREIRLVLDLDKDAAGHWIGSAIFPGLGVKGAPLADLIVQDDRVSCSVKGALGGPKLSGRLNADGGLEGAFELAGNSAPFSARRSGLPQVDLPRQSAAVRSDFVGEWQGELTFNDHPVRVKLSLANRDGKATGTLVFLGKHETTMPLDLITQDADNLTLDMQQAGASYDGVLHPGSNEIEGTFQEAGMEFPLVLHRPPAKEAKQ